MTGTVRTAGEVVELYNLVVWNERDFELAEELMGDSVIRHDVGEARTLTHEQAVQRVKDTWAMFASLRFDQSPMTSTDGTETVVSSLELFRVVDGRITEVWNWGYKQGVWS